MKCLILAPDQVTNYVICVSFDSHGQVIDISMGVSFKPSGGSDAN